MLSWTSDAVPINPCALTTGGSNNTHGCAESQQTAAITLCVTKLLHCLTIQNEAQTSGHMTGPHNNDL